MSKRTLFLALAAASLSTTACNAEKTSDSASAAPSGPVAKVPPPQGGDWSTTVTQTPEGGFLMGNPNAGIKLVEFASMTCPHCAEFEEAAMQPLIDNYVKSGQVAFEFRNFVRDPYDLAASLVARCGGTAGFFGLTRGLFADQRGWMGKVQAADPQQMQAIGAMPPAQQLGEIAKIAGFQDFAAMRGVPPAKTAQCLSNQAEIDRLVQMNSDAVAAYDIPGTPAFLINGEVFEIKPGSPPWAQIEARLKELIAG